MRRSVLWAVKVGDPNWAEVVIIETERQATMEAAKAWAQANGFDRLRVLELDGSKPDFVGAIKFGK